MSSHHWTADDMAAYFANYGRMTTHTGAWTDRINPVMQTREAATWILPSTCVLVVGPYVIPSDRGRKG